MDVEYHHIIVTRLAKQSSVVPIVNMKAFVATSLFALVAIASCEPPSPRNQYLPPSQSPSSHYLPPTDFHDAGAFSEFRGHGSDYQQTPSSAYGAPAVTLAHEYGAPTGHGFGAGNGGYSYGDGHRKENYGPAKYDFKYDVQDYTTGQDFGHTETRDGDTTTGSYYVLLPDGRKQIVKYVADKHGYRPVISYEKISTGFGGGYNKNAQAHGGFNGY